MSLESDIKSMVESLDLKIWDILTVSEHDETIYRVNIISPSAKSVSMDQVVQVTKMISPLLDVTAPVRGDYRLEVSSPGIERTLKSLMHFECSIGEKLRIQTLENKKLRGTLKSVEGDKITLETDEGEETFAYGDVIKASTYFEW
ncbi:MAG: ribosome maturation factor RimP [Campylobacterota bacterium]